ncbi:hypothetical protein [Ignicoccus hospitalis]|uniref:hypothetical protein n=1 Tax=Ignicoccus hospitalis TaxID=160233 RepID=UPI000322726E|nr:hypothetical protein [Ignicoccus hospitalis]HIH90184.1 hypothetical protein [Desulfurococcaceae archaeon]
MVDSELLSEIREIKERPTRVECMLRFIIERNIEEVEPLPDEIEAIDADDEIIDLDEIKRKLMR